MAEEVFFGLSFRQFLFLACCILSSSERVCACDDSLSLQITFSLCKDSLMLQFLMFLRFLAWSWGPSAGISRLTFTSCPNSSMSKCRNCNEFMAFVRTQVRAR